MEINGDVVRLKQEMDDTWLSAGEDYIFNSVNSGGDQNFEKFSFYKSSTNHINETMALPEKLDKKISIEFEYKDVKLELPSLSTTICKTEYQSYPSIVKIENQIQNSAISEPLIIKTKCHSCLPIVKIENNVQTNYLYEKRLLNLIEKNFDYDKNNQFQEKSRIKVNRPKKVEICMKKTQNKLSHKCNLCRKIYEGEASIKTHINTTHESTGQYECDICHKSCSFQGNLIENMNTVHDRSKPFKCDLCYKSFRQKGTLKSHIDAVHNQNKPIEWYLIYEFTQRARNEPNNWISSITDGTRKLDVILTKDSSDKINWGRGTKLKIIGDLVEIDSTYLLTISSPCNITTLDEKPMGLNDLLNGCTLIYKETT
ncbi:zinc finger and BTB domain-containing protein 41-like [Trichogramma pretiosum]|uniref:zinc finger and BTB domain-containing protein 41-like n=1 Tax=Trichogramma pretiosum TaxID=7493 RepID=UPI0006C9D439|nr:zinc finger and BTB domain-containing protein 41-like [Trichogramma pretiosum]